LRLAVEVVDSCDGVSEQGACLTTLRARSGLHDDDVGRPPGDSGLDGAVVRKPAIHEARGDVRFRQVGDVPGGEEREDRSRADHDIEQLLSMGFGLEVDTLAASEGRWLS
jgi:hypothetical protein